MSQTPLWAAYLEMILGEGDTRKRRQWVFAPPVPPEVTPEGMEPVHNSVYWYRQQNNASHKALWAVTHLNSPERHDELLALIRDSDSRLWVANPLVTCEVHPLEMKELQLEGWKTPWRFLNRITRVAKIKHNYNV